MSIFELRGQFFLVYYFLRCAGKLGTHSQFFKWGQDERAGRDRGATLKVVGLKHFLLSNSL